MTDPAPSSDAAVTEQDGTAPDTRIPARPIPIDTCGRAQVVIIGGAHP